MRAENTGEITVAITSRISGGMDKYACGVEIKSLFS